jgi:hypothetical protein
MMRVKSELAGKPLETSRLAYLGVCNLEDREWKEFADRVTVQLETAGYTIVSRLSTGVSSEVYLYLVNYGFPLASLDVVLNECRTAYSKFYRRLREDRSAQIPLHLSRLWEGRFPGLIAYTEEEAIQVKEARQILLFGTVLKVMTINNTGQREYGYTYGHPLNYKVWLGVKWEAIDSLCADSKTRRMLQQAISNRKRDLVPAQLVTLYWVIQHLRSCPQFGIDDQEQVLLLQEVQDIDRLLNMKGLLTEEMKMEEISEENRAQFCKNAAGDSIDWSGDIPLLKSLDQWEKVIDEATL